MWCVLVSLDELCDVFGSIVVVCWSESVLLVWCGACRGMFDGKADLAIYFKSLNTSTSMNCKRIQGQLLGVLSMASY